MVQGNTLSGLEMMAEPTSTTALRTPFTWQMGEKYVVRQAHKTVGYRLNS